MSRATFVAAAVALGLGGPLLASEPLYEGQPLSYWIEKYQSDDPGFAATALHALGETSVAPLRDLAKHHESEVVRRHAVHNLRIFDGAPTAALAALMDIIRDRTSHLDSRLAVAELLLKRRQKSEVVPVLVDAIVAAAADPYQTPEPSAFTALRLIRKLGPEAGPTVPPLVKALSSGDPSLRLQACEALSSIGSPTATPAVEALRVLLADPYFDIAQAARKALKDLGS